MKKTLAVLLALILVLGVSPLCFASDAGKTYYIDPVNGKDSNTGLGESDAWQTLAAASAHTFAPGDALLLKAGGIFNGTFAAKGNGTAEAPVTVGAYGDIVTDGLPLLTTREDAVLMHLTDVSCWTVSDLEFTAPKGHGVYITATDGGVHTDVTVQNCVFHNISNEALVTRYPVYLGSEGETSRLEDITIKDCHIYDCGYGIAMGGRTREWTPQWYESPEKSYNKNYVIEGVTINDLLYDAVIIGSVYGLHVKDCALLNTCKLTDHYTAPMWSHHAANFLIENCEIAGAANYMDGMAVDFDGWTTDSTYQYIYSHDNIRFIQNCCYDDYTKNANCTVRYCLSVNDNKANNTMANLLTSGSVDYAEDELPTSMINFKFYNNTLVNCSPIYCHTLEDALIANNIFIGDLSSSFITGRKSVGDNGEKKLRAFEGTFTHNCFWGVGVPSVAKNNYVCDPGFIGSDETDKNSFRLSADSELLGKGIKTEEDMGETDFYGNPLGESINIGCYGGAGENAPSAATFGQKLVKLLNTILGAVYSFIDNCNNRYWLF